MKRLFIFSLSVILIALCFIGCQQAEYNIDFTVSYSQSETESQLKLTVVNNTGDKILYFSPYISKLEKENNGNWEKVDVEEEFYQTSALLPPTEGKNSITQTQTISLEPGSYRAALDIEIYSVKYTEADDSGGATVPVQDKSKETVTQTLYTQFTAA